MNNHSLPYVTYDVYDVPFYDERINTLVTHSAHMVETWLSQILPTVNNPVVGLDLEWRPNNYPGANNRVAILQLCVDHSCLIFQILHAQEVPQALVNFLADESYTFVGVGIKEDKLKLFAHHGLWVANTVDLAQSAAYVLRRGELWTASLKTLCKEVLGKELEKPRMVTMSMWDNARLTREQIHYACLDAFISSELGRRLLRINQYVLWFSPLVSISH